MDDWDWAILDGVARIDKGRLLPTSSAQSETVVPYLGAASLEGQDPERYVELENAILCKKDDVLMLWDGERCGLVGSNLSGAASSTVARIRPVSTRIIGKYLYHHLKSRFAEIQSLRTGTGVPHVPRDLPRLIRVPLPPLEEQRRIADILDTIDVTIQTSRQIISKKKMELNGLAAYLMTDASPCQQWETRQLSQWTNKNRPITYGIVQAGPHIPDGVPYIRTGDMVTELRIDNLMRTSERIANSYIRSRISEGDIVCAIRATVGKVLLVPLELEGANLTQGTARISPGPDADRHCLLWALRSDEVKSQIRRVQKGTTFSEITLEQLRKLNIRLPTSLSEQRRLVDPLRGVESAIEGDQLTLEKLCQLRSGLAADLLSGQVRTVAV